MDKYRFDFAYGIDELVYFLNGDRISSGTIITRRVVEAPSWKEAPHLTGENWDQFLQPGNKLGSPGESYEVLLTAPVGNVNTRTFNVNQIFLSADDLLNDLKQRIS